MNFHFRSDQKYLAAFNFSSLTDVVMLLLIFFLLTSSFVVTTGLNVTLPKTVEGQPPQGKLVTVSIGKDKRLFLNNSAVEKAQLQTRLKDLLQKDKDQQIVVRADKNLALQDVVEVLDIIRGAGGARLFIATETEPEKP